RRPLVAGRPDRLAAAGVYHQLDPPADRVAGRADQQLVDLAIAPAERTPAELDRLEAARHRLLQSLAQQRGVLEQDRPVRLDAVAVAPTEQSRHRLSARLAEDVPQSDVEAADCMLNRSAAALPEGRLAQFLGHASRPVGALADPHPPQQL